MLIRCALVVRERRLVRAPLRRGTFLAVSLLGLLVIGLWVLVELDRRQLTLWRVDLVRGVFACWCGSEIFG